MSPTAPVLLRKTLRIFEGALHKTLLLQDEPTPSTDGTKIGVPFEAPEAYTLLEGVLAKLSFGASALQRDAFVSDYVGRTTVLATKYGATLDSDKLGALLRGVFDTLDAVRVESLWRRLYPGSTRALRVLRSKEVEAIEGPPAALLDALLFCAYTPARELGSYESNRAQLSTALRKVQNRSAKATSLLSRWLVSALVAQIIRETLQIPAPPQDAPKKTEDDSEPPWNPPPLQSSPREKLKALEQLLASQPSNMNGQHERVVGGSTPPLLPSQEDQAAAEAAAAATNRTNTHDVAGVDAQLEAAEQEVLRQLEAMEDALANAAEHEDGGLAVEMDGTTEVTVVPNHLRAPVPEVEWAHIRRLQALFARVRGKRESRVTEHGSEVDIASFIERRIQGDDRPVFRSTAYARGFECVVLLDRSGSMAGAKTAHVERALQILGHALNLPNVRVRALGFHGLRPGSIQLYKFQSLVGSLATSLSPVGGDSPLHLAVDAAAHDLRRSENKRVLLVLTDGVPECRNAEGVLYETPVLKAKVRASLRRARGSGVETYGAIVGTTDAAGVTRTDISASDLTKFFGDPRHWQLLPPERLDTALVALVTQVFLKHMRGSA